MKLPEDKKERNKILVLIGIGALVVVILVFQMPVVGILPLLKSKKEKIAKIEQLKTEIDKANKEIKKQERDKADNRDILQQIKETTDKFILVAELNNYEIPVANYIDPIAKKLNLKLDSKRQIGISEEAKMTYFKYFGTRVQLECSYDQLVNFIREIERGNPLVCVVNVSITGQPEKVEQHKCSFEVLWPIWADEGTPVKFEQQLKDSLPGGGSK